MIVARFRLFAFYTITCLLISSCANSGFKQDICKKSKKIDVALVLGGGGARAIAQLGVIEVLEKHEIPIDIIIGTSGGSVIGALYADTLSISEAKEKVFKCSKSDIMNFSLISAIDGVYGIHKSIIDGSNGEKFLTRNMRAKDFSELKIPFVALATDASSGSVIALDKGFIAKAVRASYSIPGPFPPVEIDGKTLVDGGVAAPLGTEIAKHYNPKLIIAVDVTSPTESGDIKNMLDLIYRCLNITYNAFNDKLGELADVLIKPDTGGAGIFDDHKRDELYEAGIKAGIAALPDIEKKMKKHNIQKRN